MARKFGKVNVIKESFGDYNYIINGVGGIGKTTVAFEMGQLATGSDEGTFIITCGAEPEPTHIPGAFYDHADNFRGFVEIVNELCDNKADYPNTKFVAIDSLDEFVRIAEAYTVEVYNKTVDESKRIKSIKQAFGGYQAGERYAADLMIRCISKLQQNGYKLIEIGHTKTKSKQDVISGIKYEQLTCNLDNYYYNAFKDKVNQSVICYYENEIVDIEKRKNGFTKKDESVGSLKSRKRVMVFKDDDRNAVDTKTHFEYIVPKTELSAANLKKAVEDAIKAKIQAVNNGESHCQNDVAVEIPKTIIPTEDEVVVTKASVEEDVKIETEEFVEIDEEKTVEELVSEIRSLWTDALKETKLKVKEMKGEKDLSELPAKTLRDIIKMMEKDAVDED